MKSQVNVLIHVMQGLFKDVLAAYPALEGVSFDQKRCALYSQTRGIGFYTLDLPHLDSLLTKGLEDGRLVLEGPLTKRKSPKIKVPRLFSGLWLRVFDENCCLKQDVDATAIAFLRQFFCLGKKLSLDCSLQRRETAVRSYHNVERSLRRPSANWDDDRLDLVGAGNRHLGDCLANRSFGPLFQEEERIQSFGYERGLLDQVQQVADLISESFDFCEPVSYSGMLEQEAKGIGFKHGPGAVAERLENWEKSHFPWWPAKLNDWFPFKSCGSFATFDQPIPQNHEVPSRLISVQKTAKSPRLIAAEPVAHQWCQQLLLSWLNDQMKKTFHGFFIDLKSQDKSKALVMSASLDRKLATVDLSEASDRLTCWTVERIFRKNLSLLSCLHAARTRYLRDDISEGGSSFIKLNKFASQGSATTFPVQSLVFLCVALASAMPHGKITWQRIWKFRNQVRVYGDDIIIPSHGYARLVRIMELLQLKVNESKSFVNGHFRESCGSDAYMGYDVTPAKPKTLVADGPASCQAVIDTTNNLFNKGYWHASHNLEATLPASVRRHLRISRHHEAGVSDLHSYSGSCESHLHRRWNSSLHRSEVRVWQSKANLSRRVRKDRYALLDFFASRHSDGNPRILSEFVHNGRRARMGLSWEPSRVINTSDHEGDRRRSQRYEF